MKLKPQAKENKTIKNKLRDFIACLLALLPKKSMFIKNIRISLNLQIVNIV